MKCYYCGKETWHAKRFENLKRVTCGGGSCTRKFLEDEKKDSARNYDAWKFMVHEIQKDNG